MKYSSYPITTLTPQDLELYEEIFGVPYFNYDSAWPYGLSAGKEDLIDLSLCLPRACEFKIDFLMGISGIEEPLLDNYLEEQKEKVDQKGRRITERLLLSYRTKKSTKVINGG